MHYLLDWAEKEEDNLYIFIYFRGNGQKNYILKRLKRKNIHKEKLSPNKTMRSGDFSRFEPSYVDRIYSVRNKNGT